MKNTVANATLAVNDNSVKVQIRHRILEDLRTRIRRDLPFYLRRLKRKHENPRNPFDAAFSELLVDDRNLAARFYIRAIVRDDFGCRIREEMISEIGRKGRFVTSEMTDHLEKHAQAIRDLYPKKLRPQMVTRQQLGCWISAFCRRRCR